MKRLWSLKEEKAKAWAWRGLLQNYSALPMAGKWGRQEGGLCDPRKNRLVIHPGRWDVWADRTCYLRSCAEGCPAACVDGQRALCQGLGCMCADRDSTASQRRFFQGWALGRTTRGRTALEFTGTLVQSDWRDLTSSTGTSQKRCLKHEDHALEWGHALEWRLILTINRNLIRNKSKSNKNKSIHQWFLCQP